MALAVIHANVYQVMMVYIVKMTLTNAYRIHAITVVIARIYWLPFHAIVLMNMMEHNVTFYDKLHAKMHHVEMVQHALMDSVSFKLDLSNSSQFINI